MPDAQSQPTPGEQRDVTIIGGGFSGTIVAAELARSGVSAWLVEGDDRLARGMAYATEEPAHLLNVPAHNMSAFADDPDHFLRRFEAIGGKRDGFAERRFYGAYLGDILREAQDSGKAIPVAGEAVGAERRDGIWEAALADGRRLRSRALVLAIGNEAPGGLAALDRAGDRYVRNPWGSEAARSVEIAAQQDGGVLIVGTGLTMVDTVLSLDEAGFAGRMMALSRRGLSPRAHAAAEPAPVALGDVPQGSVAALFRWLRTRSGRVGWRAAVDSLRPHSHVLWQSLKLDEQRRFLRHARPWWDVHRHRIAPAVAERIADLIATGRLEIAAGRIVAARPETGAVVVEIARRGSSAPKPYRFAAIINCTGPLHAISRSANPLLRSLLDGGAARPDALDIGIAVDERSRVAGADQLWAMGSLTKGRYWEIIAVPDIRAQAAAIAAQIAEELAQ
ncbi:MAG: FAD/NAD(P)-binding protein [Sphingomicrobium sp.]